MPPPHFIAELDRVVTVVIVDISVILGREDVSKDA